MKIVDLAEQMIEFMKPEEKIEMVYTGLRPGEKLHETLFEVSENAEASAHEKIYQVNPFHWENCWSSTICRCSSMRPGPMIIRRSVDC